MKTLRSVLAIVGASLITVPAFASEDWPQWLGPDRTARATFRAPASWPKELAPKWKVEVGDGVSTPALVADKLYVFTRQEGNEVLRCLDAATGKELWQHKYESLGASGPASGYSGPRCSPTVADGKVIILGVRGTLSCLEAQNGKVLWRQETGATPRFFTSSSPLIVDGLCIAQVGGEREGGTSAYDLNTGTPKWSWTEEGTAYASPNLAQIDGLKVVIVETDRSIAALNPADGKLLWQTPFAVRGRGYNASTPMFYEQMLIFSGSGRGTRAVKLQKKEQGLEGTDLWTNDTLSVQFNTPILKDGYVYGLTQGNDLVCIDVASGKTAWSTPTGPIPAEGESGGGRPRRGGGDGYGSLVDAGSILVALTPKSELIIFQPSGEKYSELGRIKVSDSPTHAYPVLAGNRIYIKDRDSIILLSPDS